MKKKHKFINETLFFPDEGILVVGDLHIGYDFMLRQSGVLIPERQAREVIERLKKIIKIVEEEYKLKKIIFLGDIKHSFSYEFSERDDFDEVMEFLRTKVDDKEIILIKGNHDTVDYSKSKKMKEIHMEKDVAFLHGHKQPLNLFDKKIKTIVLGHLHPSVVLAEKTGVKRENYKCFLTGSYKNKEVIILPSFLGIIEGSAINQHIDKEDFIIIPRKNILNFEVHIVGEDKIYDFGKVKDLD